MNILEKPLYKYTLKYGLYLGGVFSLSIILLTFMGNLHLPGDKASMINAMILVFSMLHLGRKYRKEIHKDFMSYGKTFEFIFLLSLVSAITYSLFSYIYFQYISPEAIELYKQQIELGLNEQFNFSDQENKSFMDIYNQYLSAKIMASIVFINQMLGSLILGIFAANFVKTPIFRANQKNNNN